MKLAVRILALSVVIAGAAAASFSPSSSRTFNTHQSATAKMPLPVCGPNMPNCPAPGTNVR